MSTPGPGPARTAQVLMRKGKRGAGAYIHADCASGSPQHLAGLLDVLLHPNKAIDEWETIDWCRWLIAGGRTPDEFSAIVRSYDNHAKCGLVWIPHVVAYRCRTCGISPCMSICRECFRRGDHSTHDFNMFLSQAGGACDCGDTSVMKEDGFCSNHGINNCANKSPAPADLMCVAEAMMPRVILRLLQHFRENRGAESNSDTYRKAVQECEGYVSMLMEFNNMGELMRKAMTKALINPQMYRNMVEPPFPPTEYGSYLARSKVMYEAAVDSFPAPDPPPEYKHLPALGKRMSHITLLEEFIFWTFKYEFPQNVVCFLLNMLPDQDYKEHLTRTFVMHYARIPLVLELSADPDMLSNRVVHMSVQLFSNEALALRCQHHLSLLHVMVISLKLMMNKILIKNTLHDEVNNSHMVIDCARRVMKEHCYWPLVSDFNNVLSHKSVALVFLQDDTLIDMWFQFLSMLQGMNVNERELGSHVEFEPSSYYAAFSCELEASAYPMWSIISHLTGPEHAPLARKIISCCLRYLKRWLVDINFTTPFIHRQSEVMRASFHFPLHRYLAAFLCQAVRHMGCTYSELLPDTDTLFLLMMHPLRVQSLFYEILSSIWVRNGLQIKGQAMTYIQANFCNSMVDMDIFFLQVCAAHLPTHHFLDICINTFGVSEWVGLGTLSSAREQEQDAMVEGLLTLLGTLVSSRTNLSHTELTQSRLEVSTLLATSDKTHSQLLELMPERSGNAHTRNFETVLKELSYYRAPPKGSETLEQGQFAPKAVVWAKHYDPLHVLQRAVHRRDFQNSMDRFTQYVKSSGSAGAKLGSLWPPLRRASTAPPAPGQCDPRRLAACGRVHALCMSVLHRAVHRRRPPPEHVLALAVYLLETAVDLEKETTDPSTVCQYKWNSGGVNAGPRPLVEMFPGDSLTHNSRTTIVAVAPPPPPHTHNQQQQHTHHPPQHNYPAAYDSDSDTEWDTMERVEASMNQPLPAALQAPHIEEQTEDGEEPSGTAVGLTELLVHHDYVMREEDEVSLQEEAYQLALPAPESDTTSQDMAVALPSNMTMVPTSHQVVSEMYVGDEEGDSVSMELEVGDDILSGEVALSTTVLPHNSHHHRRSNKHTIAPPAETNLILVNESIISLLLKLHSQLSGTLDSFSLDDETSGETTGETGQAEASAKESHEPMEQGTEERSSQEEPGESRIGDGPHFIGQLLRKMCAVEPACGQAVENVRATLWPRQRERQAEQRAREQREREERTRRARERQRTLMQDFVSRQREFMRKAMEEGGEGEEWLGEDEEQCRLEREYDCIICNTTSPSTEANPIGLVVLLQSSSVVGHRRPEKERSSLPLSDAERTKQKPARDHNLAAHHFRRQHDMDQHFDSWLVSVNVGWEGGVHVQTCGHHLHLACLQAYLRSLVNPQRPHNLHIDRGEFLCPVCRQLANSVLPLSPGLGGAGAPARCVPPPQETLLSDIHSFLKDHQRSPSSSNLSEAMGKAMEDMTNCTVLKFKQRGAPGPQALFLFVASVARTNLEAELVQRGGSLASPPPRYKPRPDCIVPLLDVLAVHARVLCQWPAYQWWQELTVGGEHSDTEGSGTVSRDGEAEDEGGEDATEKQQQLVAGGSSPDDHANKQLPLLLKDPLALLIHFLLLAPLHLEFPYLSCMMRALYNLCWVQCVVQALLSMNTSQLEADWLPSLPRHLYHALQGSPLLQEEDQPSTSSSSSSSQDAQFSSWSQIDKQIQQQVLPYLRVCALLRYHLAGQELPHIPDPQLEFHYLFKFLELVPQDTAIESLESSNGLHWFGDSESIVGGWVRQLLGASSRCPLLTRRLLLPQHHHWEQPALLRLPREYDRLFTYYHERICSGCGAVPKEASVCLVCGAVVCLKQSCCRQQEVCEAVQHSVDCGGGTGVFLVVTSTYIIIVRGRRACLWGSLYLDDYDEEDRDLKRGKPLYLSEDRFELLEQQWLAHRFDHTKRTWVWHRDSL